MKKNILYLLLMGIIIAIGCQKEESFELPNTPAEGSLQDDASGDCLPKTVNGVYAVGVALVPTTNSITVSVNVTKTGTYTVYTDTVNGYYFRGTGSFTTLGANTVTLNGNGTPFAAGTNNFVVNFGGTVCDIQVTVTSPAVFTLSGAPTNCTTPVINGTYGKDVPLTTANTVVLNVNVTTAGSYNVTTTAVNGMTFSGSGVFSGTGAQTITLTGSGTPTTVGANTIPVTAGSSTCSFTITVVGPGVATLGGAPTACTPSTINGTYVQGVALTSANTVTIQVNVTTAGVINVTTNTVTGFSFSYSGALNTGVQNINLVGTGTPAATGTQNFTVTLGSSSCTFSVPVTGPGAGTLGGAPTACTPSTVNGVYYVGTATTATNTVTIQVNVTTPGSFNITTGTVTGFAFAFTGALSTTGLQNVDLVANGGTPTTAGPQTFTVSMGSGSTCTFVVNVLANDYYPRTTNSNWSYEWNDDPTDSVQYKVYPSTLSAIGNTYNIFMPNEGAGFDSTGNYSAGYYRRNGGDYFQWFDYGTFLGYDNPGWAEYIMLKDNVAAGTNWKSAGFPGTISGNPANIRFSYTILQKDVPVTITSSLGTVTYQNVIVVQEKYEIEVTPGVWQDLTSTIDFYGKSYYARGIGLIKYEALDASNAVTDFQELRRYQVF
ncbi:MAG: hypothetical protein U0U70_05355 [Chitinophagaceae bacterium]